MKLKSDKSVAVTKKNSRLTEILTAKVQRSFIYLFYSNSMEPKTREKKDTYLCEWRSVQFPLHFISIWKT